jgi:DHA1 family multidrug resistance protein-like MFS transporter
VQHTPFFLASGAWNFGHGMTWLAVPLYAHSQGLSNAEIGALFAAPVLAQAPLNLVGGAYTDRIGGRRIMLASCFVVMAAGVWFSFAHGFWMLMAGQVALILSRAAFWPATWAMASELPGERGRQLGRLNAITNFGQIVGTVLCGFVLATAGFQATFAILAATGVISLFAGMATPVTGAKAAPGARHPLAGYLPLLRRRIIIYTMLCAYLSALPFSLAMSFYPLLFAQFGHGEGTSGVLLSLRAVGSIFASLLASRFVRSGPQTLWPVACGLVVATAIGLAPTVNHAAPLGLWMLVVGAGTAAMTLYFQITIAEASSSAERGSALALGGMGWSVSHLSTPLLMGFLADRYGIVTGFYVLGGFALACAVLIALTRHWAFRQG